MVFADGTVVDGDWFAAISEVIVTGSASSSLDAFALNEEYRVNHSPLAVTEQVLEQSTTLTDVALPLTATAEFDSASVDSRYASLVDALNAFDGADDAEIGGNLALQPKLEELYY